MTNDGEASRYRELRRMADSAALDHLSGGGPPTWMLSYIGSAAGKRVLDLGAGDGALLQSFTSGGANLALGLDIDEAAAAIAERRGISVLIAPVQDALQTLETYAPFDVVTMNHVIEHLPRRDVQGTLTQVRALLRPNGSLLVATPNAQAPTGAYWLADDATHQWAYTAGSLFYHLTLAGFVDFRVLDPLALADTRSLLKRGVRRASHRVYRSALRLRNHALGVGWNATSPDVFTWEVKVGGRRPP